MIVYHLKVHYIISFNSRVILLIVLSSLSIDVVFVVYFYDTLNYYTFTTQNDQNASPNL